MIINIHALITRIKSPSVRTVRGIVKNTIKGFMNVLINARRMEMPTAVKKLLTLTPLKI
jgi:hypothetical protein